YPRTEPLQQPLALGVGERAGGLDVENRLHPRGGDVRVLASRPRGAARLQLDLGERNFGAAGNGQPVAHGPGCEGGASAGSGAPSARRTSCKAKNKARAAN